MSSTKFNVGLLDSGRSSSRVLKPPGGGHSDIFGIHDEQQPKAKSRHQSSELKSCLTFDEPAVQAAEIKVMQSNDRKLEENLENAEPEKKQEETKQPTAAQRVRVPPGGFSSGLW